MKILLITGGSSPEREISLLSAAAVKSALEDRGHLITMFDFKRGYTELQQILPMADVVFPVMHGKEGEDGTLYQLLKSAKKPYVGSDPTGSYTAFNKIELKRYYNKVGVPTAAWKIVTTTDDIISFGFPCVLKGANGGSSYEVVLLHSDRDLQKKETKQLLESNNEFFVEKLLQGTEITVGILLEKALPVLEIIPPNGEWFDYKNKYSGITKEIPFAPSISENLQQQAQKLALQIHTSLNLGSFSRTDIIVSDNTPYLIETNTPGGVGLTTESLFPKAAAAAGINFGELVEKILAGRL